MITYLMDKFSPYTLFKTRLADFLSLHIPRPVKLIGTKMQPTYMMANVT